VREREREREREKRKSLFLASWPFINSCQTDQVSLLSFILQNLKPQKLNPSQKTQEKKMQKSLNLLKETLQTILIG